MDEPVNISADRRPKVGLVLEGGGLRGIFTAGVLDILMDHSFRPDTICATSAGATFGINLPSGQRGRVLPDELDKFDYQAYSESETDFFACVTNTRTGLPEYLKVTDAKGQIDYIRASASLPFLSRKVIIEGEPYLDGGISDNIPLDKCIGEGCERIVVVLTHPKGYLKKGSMYLLSRILYPRDKALQEAFKFRNQRYNARLEQIESLEAEGKIFVIRPSEPLALSRLEKDHSKIQAAYDMGCGVAQALWPSLDSYLKQ